MIVLDMQARAK